MSTLTGVIKAAINLDYYPDIRESDLYTDNSHFFLTSGLYPVEYTDTLVPNMVKPEFRWQEWQVDEVSIGLLPPKVYRRNAVKYWDYKNTPPESIGIALLAPSVSRVTAVRYLTYDNAEPESLAVAMLPPAVFRQKVADYFDYIIPEESLAVAMLAPSVKRTNT